MGVAEAEIIHRIELLERKARQQDANNAEVLAELRDFREQHTQHAKAHSKELCRIYELLMDRDIT